MYVQGAKHFAHFVFAQRSFYLIASEAVSGVTTITVNPWPYARWSYPKTQSFDESSPAGDFTSGRSASSPAQDARRETKKLEEAGILVRSETRDGILEELPEAYKNVDEVIEVVHCAGLARKVARLRPMGVIKG